MEVHLVDGTYELFRHFYALPEASDDSGQEIAAVRGVLTSILSLLDGGATHIGVACDHVIESFRNDLYPGYKTGEGIDPSLFSQFPILEEALAAMGVKVWAMVEFEADDALAAAAARAAANESVDRVIICTPDKDLAQCVVADRVVQLDRRQNLYCNEAAVTAKFGVKPESIIDYLALVGDSADGYPGLKGWGAKSAATVLSIYHHLEDIPQDARLWANSVRGASRLANTLRESWDDALLFRTLATLRLDVPVFDDLTELKWRGPQPSFESICQRLKADSLYRKTEQLVLTL